MPPKSNMKFRPRLPTVTGMLIGLASPSLWACAGWGGDVMISNGVVATTAGSESIGDCYANATVTGTGSQWSVNGILTVGNSSGAGTLTIQNGGAVSSSNGIIGSTGTGTVTVNGAGSSWVNSGGVTIGYISSGTGTLTIQNGGIFSSGNNAYIGLGSTGTVSVDGAGSSWTNADPIFIGYSAGTGTLSIQNGGRVNTGSVLIGYTGGSGTLNLSGSAASRGVLETGFINNQNTITFNWNGGILRATSTQSNYLQNFGTGSITVGSNGAFFDTNGYNVDFTNVGVLTGAGGLTKQGAGTLSIAGGNTYSGSTTVSADTLQFGSYTQSAGQTLTVGASSNSSYGKLAVTGTATFNAGANLAVDVAGANTLAVGQTLTNVVSAGTLNASTFSVTDNSALFNFNALLNGNAVNLNVISNNSSGVLDAVLAQGLYTAQGAAQVLDRQVNGSPTGDMATVVTALGQLGTNSAVARAAAQTLPLQSGFSSLRGVLGAFNEVLQNHLGSETAWATGTDAVLYASLGGPGELPYVEPTYKGQAWARAFGVHADQADDQGTSGFAANTSGMAFGGDAQVGPDQHLGLAYAYANTQVSGNTGLTGTVQNAGLQTHLLALYGSYTLAQDLALTWQTDVGLSRNQSARSINFGVLARTASADYNSYSAHAGASFSRPLALDAETTLTPAMRADYTWLGSDAYTETGAGALDLQVGTQSTDALVLGTDLQLSLNLSSRAHVAGTLGLGFDTFNKRNTLVAAYAGAPTQVFTTTEAEPSPWLGRVGVEYAYTFLRGPKLSLQYEAQVRGPLLNQSAAAKASWAF